MAEAKRSSKINELENELHGLEFLFHQLEQVEESKVLSFLAETGYGSRQEIESARNKVMQSLRKAKGEPKNEQDETEKVDPAANEKYSLINIPDDMLTQEQVCFCIRQMISSIINKLSCVYHIFSLFWESKHFFLFCFVLLLIEAFLKKHLGNKLSQTCDKCTCTIFFWSHICLQS